jgi:unsaturated chondroitin disaccharide hydrolase
MNETKLVLILFFVRHEHSNKGGVRMDRAINQQKLRQLGHNLTQELVVKELDWCAEKIARNMRRFRTCFPAAAAKNGIYARRANDDWTNGFWTGLLWLSYEHTGEEQFKTLALQNIVSFEQRLLTDTVLAHHDIGFLYSLSVGAGYKLTRDERFAVLLVQAAERLVARFQPTGRFIQAWGIIGRQNEYRLIIDSLLNLPLLYRASEISCDDKYRNVADAHYETVLQTAIKADGTTYHTYYFDFLTGRPLYGKTHQGRGDDSVWARGQAWAVLGIPLCARLQQANALPTSYLNVVSAFLQRLPADFVPYWDFAFVEGDDAPKDSSALAIAAHGLLESVPFSIVPEARLLAAGMAYQLASMYTSKGQQENEGLLMHGVYAYPQGKGIDEPNIFGDYFYFALLMQLARSEWQGYW